MAENRGGRLLNSMLSEYRFELLEYPPEREMEALELELETGSISPSAKRRPVVGRASSSCRSWAKSSSVGGVRLE